MAHSRRDFLAGIGCAALTRTAFAIGAEKFMAVNALAGPYADTNSHEDYKALVCIFLFGGNDANNMVIPRTDYGLYADQPGARGGSAIQIPYDSLLPINPPSDPFEREYGLHPSLTRAADEERTRGLYQLWQDGKVAIVTGVGTLIQPITLDEYRRFPTLRPYQLFSHSDQQNQSQTSYAQGAFQTGWGGRTADVVDPWGFPTIASVAGVTIFSAGRSTRPIVLPPAPTLPNQSLVLARAGDMADDSPLRQLIAADNMDTSPLLVRNSAKLSDQAIRNSLLLNRNPTVASFQAPIVGLDNQLIQIAKLIALAQSIGTPPRRQIFFASIGGFDTHSNQSGVPLAGQSLLLRYVSDAMADFYDALKNLEGHDYTSQVTTFTLSDFNRTFNLQPGATGTDHAWAGHQLVMGGAVRGGDFYGRYPNLEIRGPEDVGSRGMWLPNVSVDQYAATLAKWFGVSDTDLNTVFPNLRNFSPTDLGFML